MCPICRLALQQQGRTLKCPQNHTFDIARQGYVNLLQTRKKMPETVGDSKEMLHARRDFFAQDHYAPLSDGIKDLVAQQLHKRDSSKPTLILDVGCGEGYYLDQLADVQAFPQLCLMGMDISKAAVRLAARRVPNGRFFVSSVNGRIPLPDQSVFIILNIFSPRNNYEFARLLSADGHLIIVIPQSNHLETLREHFGLLQIESDKREKIRQALSDTFELKTTTPIQIPLQLTNKDLENLLRMTPNARHLPANTWEKAAATHPISTTAAFEILHFMRR